MLSTSQFLYDRPSRRFIAEASTLGYTAGENPPDTIQIQSAATGRYATFNAWAVIADDSEGELTAWVYKPADKSVQCEVHIIND